MTMISFANTMAASITWKLYPVNAVGDVDLHTKHERVRAQNQN